jgi:hypothetical protein
LCWLAGLLVLPEPLLLLAVLELTRLGRARIRCTEPR